MQQQQLSHINELKSQLDTLKRQSSHSDSELSALQQMVD